MEKIADKGYRASYIVTFLFFREDRSIVYDKLIACGLGDTYAFVKQGDLFISYEEARQTRGVSLPPRLGFDPNKHSLDDLTVVLNVEIAHIEKERVVDEVSIILEERSKYTIEELREHITAKLGDITVSEEGEGLSSDNVVERFRIQYMEEKEANKRVVKLGNSKIDEATGGMTFGKMAVLNGFSGGYKTTNSLNWMYNAMKQGYNCMFLTLEMPEDELQDIFLSIHSYCKVNSGEDTSISSEKLSKKLLTEKELNYAEELLIDLATNPKHGKYAFVHGSKLRNFDYLYLQQYIDNLAFPIDLVFVDYVQILAITEGRRSSYDQGNYAVAQFSKLAAGDAKHPQRLVILLSQANRQGNERASERGGEYDLRSLSEINRLERDASYVVSTFQNEELALSGQISMQVLKNRRGASVITPFNVDIFPACGVIGDLCKTDVSDISIQSISGHTLMSQNSFDV